MSNDKQERIVCAAIKDIAGSVEAVTLCVQYPDGYVSAKIGRIERVLGFITNKNRFVDPKEAMGIAIGAGQILYLNELLDAYINDVIGSRVISPQARMILNAWEHQRKMAECRELKPEDLY